MKQTKIVDVLEQNIQKIYQLAKDDNYRDITEICSELCAMSILIHTDGVENDRKK